MSQPALCLLTDGGWGEVGTEEVRPYHCQGLPWGVPATALRAGPSISSVISCSSTRMTLGSMLLHERGSLGLHILPGSQTLHA